MKKSKVLMVGIILTIILTGCSASIKTPLDDKYESTDEIIKDARGVYKDINELLDEGN